MLPAEPIVGERIPLNGSASDHEQDYRFKEADRFGGGVLLHGKLGAQIGVEAIDHHQVELSGSDVLSTSVFLEKICEVFSGHEVFLVCSLCYLLSDLCFEISEELIEMLKK